MIEKHFYGLIKRKRIIKQGTESTINLQKKSGFQYIKEPM